MCFPQNAIFSSESSRVKFKKKLTTENFKSKKESFCRKELTIFSVSITMCISFILSWQQDNRCFFLEVLSGGFGYVAIFVKQKDVLKWARDLVTLTSHRQNKKSFQSNVQIYSLCCPGCQQMGTRAGPGSPVW